MVKWQTLSSSLFDLQDRLGVLIATEAAIENAIRSKGIPVRGPRGGAFARIETEIFDKATILLLSSYIRLKPYNEYFDVTGKHQNEYNDVEVDVVKLERWLRENALPAELDAETCDSMRPTVKAEKDFERWLRRQSESPIQIKDDVWASIKAGTHEIGETGKSLSKRAFNSKWTEASPGPWHRAGRRSVRNDD